ncbi:MAG: hypothetical protein KC502_08010 [Myxococcales bacterium]|nr:hypothetical protein [Myxococcales bacterium]
MPTLAVLLLAMGGCADPDKLHIGPYELHLPSSGDAIAVDVPTTDAGSAQDTGADAAGDPCVSKVCDDGDSCTTDSCKDGACVHVASTGQCDDGNACTAGDACTKSGCVGTAKSCDDTEPCTADGCDPKTGACSHEATKAPCSDGNACTTKDACVGKSCKGTGISCDDGNPCTNDGCNPTGDGAGCTHTAAAGGCDDGDVCTVSDVCKAGACASGAAKLCDDGDACTKDSCDAKKGCVHQTTDGNDCDDGNPCTASDACASGKCVGTGVCGCASNADCAKVGSGNLCLGKLVCDPTSKQCVVDPKSVVVCAGPSACGSSACNAKTGLCEKSASKDGSACDADGDACTVADACDKGTCKPGKTTTCDDNNPCTTDACNAKQGCLHSPNNKPCDADSNACTTDDYCQKGACVPGATKPCSDGKPCTADSCDAKTGKCVHVAKTNDGQPCDADASICTWGDACKDGACKPGKALPCDDSNPCTTDGCNPLTGCTNGKNAMPCSDGNGCTVGDACSNGGCKSGSVKPCIDGDKCTLDSCNTKTGSCTFVEIVGCSKKCVKASECTDNNPCTDDVCDSGVCKNPANSGQCDDGSVCTSGDQCQNGTCITTGKKDCNDGNPCTDDSCHPKAGCRAEANSAPCDADGDKCTASDVCKDKACSLGPKKKCDDSSSCTKDSCNPKTGLCSHDGKGFDGDACDADGSVCTVGDACANGVCAKGKALACDDNNSCTTDSCNPKTGCAHTTNAGKCSDGDACTTSDSCVKGSCVPGAAKKCDDGKPCTTDACNKGVCTATPIAGCGNFCAEDADCDDNNGCTINTCDVSSGACKKKDRVGACKDGDKCWLSGTCKSGSCTGGKKADCSDGNACTTDTCNGKTGHCVFTGNSNPCDDGDPCTSGDKCAFAKCAAGQPKACDDKDLCTVDACEPKTGGCVHTKTSGQPCDDGNACTHGEKCDKGACKLTTDALALSPVGTGVAGFVNGPADKAQFNQPWSAKPGPNGLILVAELGSNTIRAIDQDGVVSTWAGTGKSGLLNGPKDKARFTVPADAQMGLEGEVYVADMQNNVIRMVDSKGVVSTFAGKGQSGFVDGYKTVARFNQPTSLAVDESGVYVADFSNHAIRLITIDGQVVTLAGNGKAGFKDGPGAQARFSSPNGIARGIQGGLYVADSNNHRLRFVSYNGQVVTVAGSKKGFQDGSIQNALFDTPYGLGIGNDGTLYIAERGNRRIRRYGLDGLVYTVFGDGSLKMLNDPFGVAIDGNGTGWVASFGSNRLHRFKLSVTFCSDGDVCTDDLCDGKSGKCGYTPKKTGQSCGKGCFLTQICQSGKCVSGQPKNCDDNNNCTGDYCVDGGCKHVPIPKCAP